MFVTCTHLQAWLELMMVITPLHFSTSYSFIVIVLFFGCWLSGIIIIIII